MTKNDRFELDQLAEVTGGTYGIPPPFINGVDTSGRINSVPRPILSGFIHKYGGLQKIPKVVLTTESAITAVRKCRLYEYR